VPFIDELPHRLTVAAQLVGSFPVSRRCHQGSACHYGTGTSQIGLNDPAPRAERRAIYGEIQI